GERTEQEMLTGAEVAARGLGVLVPSNLFFRERRRLVDLAAKSQLPAVYPWRDFVDAGGLMSYGANPTESSRRAAPYVDKILKGAKPGDLPVEQPTKFELVINLNTAKVLGLTIPQSVLGRRIRSSNDRKPRHEFPNQEGHHR